MLLSCLLSCFSHPARKPAAFALLLTASAGATAGGIDARFTILPRGRLVAPVTVNVNAAVSRGDSLGCEWRWHDGHAWQKFGNGLSHAWVRIEKPGSYQIELVVFSGWGSELEADTLKRTVRVNRSRPPGIHPLGYSVSREWLADFAIHVVNDSGSGVPVAKNAQLRRGCLLALKMWESVIPAMNVREAATRDEADLLFAFDDYYESTGATWTAHSVFPDRTTGRPRTRSDGPAEIRMNTYGADTYAFTAFHFVSRTKVYDSFRPTTYPPYRYRHFCTQVPPECSPCSWHTRRGEKCCEPGRMNGYYTYRITDIGADGEPRERPGFHVGDVAAVAFHEFGHVLGMQHVDVSEQEVLEWFNRPDSARPAGVLPFVVADTTRYPELPRTYVGEGVYDCASGKFSAPGGPYRGWNVKHDGAHPIIMSHVRGGIEWPVGVPRMPWECYNNRVVFPEDVAALPDSSSRDWRLEYPEIRGTIRLEKADGSVRHVSNWHTAISLTQLDRRRQHDAWFVIDVQPDSGEQVD